MNFLPLKFYINASFINFLTSFILGIILLKNKQSKSSNKFSLLSFAIAQWSFFYCMWLLSKDPIMAEYYLRTCMLGIFFVPTLFVHYVTLFVNKPKSSVFYAVNYGLSIVFALTTYTSYYANTPESFLGFPLWLKAGPVFLFVILQFGILIIYSLSVLIKETHSAKGVFKNQLRYMTIGAVVGFTGGATNYTCWYRIPIPPYLNALVSVYVAFTALAIIRYKLWDIHVLAKQWTVNAFITVTMTITACFALVLFNSLAMKITAMALLSLLATIYLPKLKSKTETTIGRMLYKEKYKYQTDIEEFTEKLVLIPEENLLIKSTAEILAKTLGVKTVEIFIYDASSNGYISKTSLEKTEIKILADDTLIKWLKDNKRVFTTDETEKNVSLPAQINAVLCVPALLSEDLLAIILLGERESGDMYSHIDLSILRKLGAQFAVALNYKRIEAKLREEQNLANIGIMSMEISHEMRNLLQSPQTFMDLVVDRKDDVDFMTNFRKMALDRMKVVSDKLYDIMYFGKDRPLNVTPDVDINAIIDSNLLANEYIIKQGEIEISKEYADIPKITADKSQMTHILNNLIINAIDAMKGRTGKIRLRTKLHTEISDEMKQTSDNWIRIEVKDDGEGIPDDVLQKLFTPFVTTKSMGGLKRQGTGLGLAVVKKAVIAHHGYIYIHSKQGKGTTMIVDLPVRHGGQKMERPNAGLAEDVKYFGQ